MPDEDGVEFASPDEARAEAVVAAGEALKDTGRRFWGHPEWLMVVQDESGEVVCRLRFSAE